MNRIPYPFELETERLVIRSPSVEDAPQLQEAIIETIETLSPWMPWADHLPTLDESEESCRNAEVDFQKGSDHRFHLFLKDSLTFVGGSGLHRIDWTVPKAEIGYWVRTSCSSKGYITEAVEGICRYAMEELKMNRVEIRMNSNNLKSRRIPERLGFTLEGTIRNHMKDVDNKLRDTCIYSIIAYDQQSDH